MKILFISIDSNIYGANRAMINLLSALCNRGEYECEVLLARHGEIEEELKRLDVTYYVYKFCPWITYKREKKIKDIFRKIYNYWAFKYICVKLKNKNFDIVHTNSSITNLGAYLKKKWKCKHVWHIRETLECHCLKYIYSTSVVKNTYDKTDKIIMISDYMKEQQHEFINLSNCITVYDGIEVANEENEKHCGFYFIITGLITPIKNQLLVCKALKRLLDEGYQDVFCYIVGGIGDELYSKELNDYIEEKKLKNNIIQVGHAKYPKNYYKRSDVGIMASDGEGFGLVTVEYMVNRLMVLGADSGATPEIIKEGVNGKLFKNNDVADLAEKMKWCIEHKNEMKSYGEQARKVVKDKFSIDIHVKKIISVYKSLYTLE